jgi:hypothetical protein
MNSPFPSPDINSPINSSSNEESSAFPQPGAAGTGLYEVQMQISQLQQLFDSRLDYDIVRLFRTIGYGLLLIGAVIYLNFLFPLAISQPAWILQVSGNLTQNISVALVGFALIFYAGSRHRKPLAKRVLPILSWLTILLAVFYLALIPADIVSATRVYRTSEQNIETQVKQNQAALAQAKTAINNAGSLQQLQQIRQVLQVPGAAPTDPQAIRSDLLSRLQQSESGLVSNSQVARNNLRMGLITLVLKQAVLSLICAWLFWQIWSCTAWSRKGRDVTTANSAR